MRIAIDIIINPSLLGLQSKFPILSSIQPNTFLKLSQGSKYLYLKYQPNLQSNPSTSISKNKLQLPSKLCQLNGIVAGAGQLQPVLGIPVCSKITALVSSLDWQIISNQSTKLQQQFLNQIPLVWPQAQIPLYYDRTNSITLKIQCDKLSEIKENSQIEILVQNSNINQNQKSQNVEKWCYNIKQVRVMPAKIVNEGNINKVFFSKSHPIFQLHKTSKVNTSVPNQQKINHNNSQVYQQQIKQQNLNCDKIISNFEINELNNLYEFKLKYTSIDLRQQNQVPCDTNKIRLRQQITMINNTNKNKLNIKIGQKDKLLDVLVSVQMFQQDQQHQQQSSLKIYKPNPIINKHLTSSISSNKPHPSTKKAHQQQQIIGKQFKTYDSSILSQPKQQLNTIIYLNQQLLSYWGIDPLKQLYLHQILKKDHLNIQSKKLNYLLSSVKQLNVQISISEKDDTQNQLNNVKEAFVDNFINYLTRPLNTNTNENNSICIYSKIPYIITLKNPQKQKKSSSPTKNYSKIATFVSFKKNENPIADPLVIIHRNIANNENQQLQKQVSQIKNKFTCKVKVINHYYGNQNKSQISSKVSVLNKINYIIRKQSSINDKNTKQQTFLQLFKICYKSQIQKILSILQQTPQTIRINHDINNINDNQQSQQTISQQQDQPHQYLPILITSFSNNGKTILNTLLRQHSLQTLYLDFSQLDTSFNLADISKYLELAFQLSQSPVIFIDNLDSICYKVQSGDLNRNNQRTASKLILRKLIHYTKLYSKQCIFTCKNHNNLDEQLKNYQLIKLKNPPRQIRTTILQFYSNLKKSNIKLNINRKINYQSHQFLSSSNIQQIIDNSQSMSFGQFTKYIITGHKQQQKINKDTSNPCFNNLAGIKQAKHTIKMLIQKPLKYGFLFKKLPIKLSRGILLYGGSGTGKTAIGQSLANEFMMKFFSIKGSDILSKYIGGSEASVRDIFQKAMSVSPSIIFFDQFQSIVPRRNSFNTGVTDRVVNQFLCYLDGVASVEGVYIVAATSRPQLIDPALLRPGRIDTHIFLDYPNEQERQELLGLYQRSIKFQTPMEQLLTITQGYSYSDLIGLIKQLRIKKSAQIISKNTNIFQMNSSTKINSEEFKFIDNNFLKRVLENFKVSVSGEEKKRQKEKFLAFKRGDVPDVSKQKTLLY